MGQCEHTRASAAAHRRGIIGPVRTRPLQRHTAEVGRIDCLFSLFDQRYHGLLRLPRNLNVRCAGRPCYRNLPLRTEILRTSLPAQPQRQPRSPALRLPRNLNVILAAMHRGFMRTGSGTLVQAHIPPTSTLRHTGSGTLAQAHWLRQTVPGSGTLAQAY
jgi:hypothetical protein